MELLKTKLLNNLNQHTVKLILTKNTVKNDEKNFSQKKSIKITSFSTNLKMFKLCLGKANGTECKTPLNNKDFPITADIEEYNGIWFEYDLLQDDGFVDYELA